MTAYCVILRSRSPASSGGGSSKLSVTKRPPISVTDGDGSSGRHYIEIKVREICHIFLSFQLFYNTQR